MKDGWGKWQTTRLYPLRLVVNPLQLTQHLHTRETQPQTAVRRLESCLSKSFLLSLQTTVSSMAVCCPNGSSVSAQGAPLKINRTQSIKGKGTSVWVKPRVTNHRYSYISEACTYEWRRADAGCTRSHLSIVRYGNDEDLRAEDDSAIQTVSFGLPLVRNLAASRNPKHFLRQSRDLARYDQTT